MLERSSAAAEKWDASLEADRLRDEIANAVRDIGFALAPRTTQERQIQRVACKAGMSWGQIKRLWHHERQEIPGHIVDRIRDIREQLITSANQVDDHLDTEQNRIDRELADVKRRIANLEAHARENSTSASDSPVHSLAAAAAH